MKKSSKMKKYIKPEIICTKMEHMQLLNASIQVSDKEATGPACAKEYHLSNESLWDWDEEDD